MTATSSGQKLFAKPLINLCYLRSFHYFLEYQALQTLSALLTKSNLRSARFSRENLTILAREIRELFESDVQNILNSDLPPRLLWTESPISHLQRLPKIVSDGIDLSLRRRRRQAHEFSDEAQMGLDKLPEYYRRNFHFQTDGYLSEHSAELYDHQVELLFAGAADAMRRIVLPDVVEALHSYADAASKQIAFLELGCGTGAMTRNIHLTFPHARIVATDLSVPYLEMAKKRFSKSSTSRNRQIEFIEANATQLPFKDQSFDAVYSVFLFHELPREVRIEVIREARRVLKPGGVFFYIDSLQLGDKPHFDHVLKNFPRDFHEPFYLNYIDVPMHDLVESAGFELLATRFGFLAKGEVYRGRKI